MKKLNKIFAIVCIVLTFLAMYGVVVHHATHHVATAFICGFMGLLFIANEPEQNR